MTIIDEKFKKEFGSRLQALRKNKNLTIDKFVETLSNEFHLDMDEKSVRRYECGEYLPKIDNLIAISEYFGVSLDFLIYGKQTSDDNSYTWQDTFKRLNRLIFSAVLIPWMENNKNSPFYGKYYFTSYDEEVSVYMERLLSFTKDKNYNFEVRRKSPFFDIQDYDHLIGDFGEYTDDLRPSPKRMDDVLRAAHEDPKAFLKERLRVLRSKTVKKSAPQS
mgnify:CR=1 FL=1